MLSRPAPRSLLLCCALAGIVLALYGRTAGFGFTNLDDDRYVVANPHLQDGLTAASLRWAVTSGYESVYIPATWVSLLADVTLQGTGPRGFHLTNTALHLANVLLLFLLLRALGAGPWRSAAAAALLAAHPLNVEAAAWVTGRKDLLAAFFLLSALLVHARRVRGCGPSSALAVWILGALAMLAKPSAVILPALQLLLDMLVLRRGIPRRRLLLELVPLVVVALAMILAAYHTAHGGIYGDPVPVPWLQRAGRAPVFVAEYLGRILWPQGLCAVYPGADQAVGPGRILFSVGLLAGLTTLALRRGAGQPLVLLGWLWFLVSLLPVLDLVQGGQQLLSDRYAYVPAVGVFIALVWGLGAVVPTGRRSRATAAVLFCVWLAALATVAGTQIPAWRDGEAVWRRALAVAPDNHQAHAGLAYSLQRSGRLQEALTHAQQAVSIASTHQGHYILGSILYDLGRGPQARAQLERAVALRADFAQAYNLLGSVLGRDGDLPGARDCFARAVALAPQYAQARYNLGLVLLAQGEPEAARRQFTSALALEPGHPWARQRLQELEAAGN